MEKNGIKRSLFLSCPSNLIQYSLWLILQCLCKVDGQKYTADVKLDCILN